MTVKAFGSKQTQSLTKIHVKQTLVWLGLLTKSPSFGAGDNNSRCGQWLPRRDGFTV
ncbi:hypothetical protein MtrunA17_Chr6g0459291 [Medicago truncatula]|uniref:Uncharacterized protein n=1 Tax=Medicago truncatula TaxID=3880 RepID=A0A396HBL2_MEDTR|nr:hypothetical protein MtrunA17_Chr6g0459291 [Medicago truncatula]